MYATILGRYRHRLPLSRHEWAAIHCEGYASGRGAGNLEVRFVASEGAGSHGTLHAGDSKTTVKDRKKEIGKGLLGKILADLGIGGDDFQET